MCVDVNMLWAGEILMSTSTSGRLGFNVMSKMSMRRHENSAPGSN